MGYGFIIVAIALSFWAFARAWALTANANVTTLVGTNKFTLPVGAGVHLYRNALAGKDPAGYLKAFVPGDVFAGLVDAEVDNSSGDAGDEYADVYLGIPIVYTLTSVAQDDIGKPVYATADNAIALTGNYDAYAGRVVGVDGTNLAIIMLKQPGEEAPNGVGSIKLELTGHEQFSATGADGATHGNVYIGVPGGAFEGKSILGTGITPNDAENGGIKLSFDAVAEIALASVRTINDCLPVDKGVRLDVDFVASDSGDNAALDIVVGFGTALTTNSEADADHADMAQLAAFHIDGNSDNILCESDDATTDVAPVDSTVDNDSATDVPKHLTIIGRPTGAVEFWIDNARVLSTTTFALLSTANVAAFVNMEKTSNDTTAEVIFRNLRVTGGCAALAA